MGRWRWRWAIVGPEAFLLAIGEVAAVLAFFRTVLPRGAVAVAVHIATSGLAVICAVVLSVRVLIETAHSSCPLVTVGTDIVVVATFPASSVLFAKLSLFGCLLLILELLLFDDRCF